MSAYVLQQILNGLTLGSLYALVAIGFSMIYSIVRLINFAHGDIAMVGAFATLGLVAVDAPWLVTIVIVLLTGGMAGITIEAVVFRSMRGAPQVTGFIATLAVSVVIQNTGIMIFSGQPQNFLFPSVMRQRVALGPVTISLTDIAIVTMTIVLLAILLILVKRTRLGIGMRAAAENLQVARLMGININRTIMAAFAIGSAMAAIAGLMWGGRFGQIDPLFGFIPGLKAFVASVIGGVGSLGGAVLGGYLLGLSEVLFVGLMPSEYSGYRDAFVFFLLILILLVLPNGLLGRSAEERA